MLNAIPGTTLLNLVLDSVLFLFVTELGCRVLDSSIGIDVPETNNANPLTEYMSILYSSPNYNAVSRIEIRVMVPL